MHSGHAKEYLAYLLERISTMETPARESHRQRLIAALGAMVIDSPYVRDVLDTLWQTHSDEISRLLESTGNFQSWQESQ